MTVSIVRTSKLALLSLAVFLRAKLAQQGDDEAPNRCSNIWWSTTPFVKSLSSHQRKRKASESSGLTLTWRNICSTSANNATGYCRNRRRSPVRLFVKSGPWSNWSFKEVSLKRAAQSKTTLTLLGFWGWNIGWCGKYQSFPGGGSIRVKTFLAWPLAIYWLMVSLYFSNRGGSARKRLSRACSLSAATERLFDKQGICKTPR